MIIVMANTYQNICIYRYIYLSYGVSGLKREQVIHHPKDDPERQFIDEYDSLGHKELS